MMQELHGKGILPPFRVYLDRALIFRLFLFSLRIRFLRHLALILVATKLAVEPTFRKLSLVEVNQAIKAWSF
jgi:hypothetical protein